MMNLIDKFNQTLKSITNGEPYFIQFSIVPESDTTMLWKLFIRITCSRISTSNGKVSDKIVVTLNQFLSTYQSLTQQLLILEQQPSNHLNVSTSTIFFRSLPVFDTLECLICMDHQSNLVLPCEHKICDGCFKQWTDATSSSGCQTCPICRSDINIDDGFILTDMPKTDCVKKTLMESILALPMDYKDVKN